MKRRRRKNKMIRMTERRTERQTAGEMERGKKEVKKKI